jgi:putative ABC transport system permease protein
MAGESLWRDMRYALRALARTPAFSGVVTLSLALAIGANTAIFTLINAVMLRPLPVRDPGQLVEPLHRYPGEPRLNGFSWESYRHFQKNNHVFSGVIGFAPASFSARIAGAEPETLHGEYVTGDYFPVLGIHAARGRLIGSADTSPVAVVSWPLWDRVFHRDPAILGNSIAAGNQAVTVIGVAPQGFAGFETWNPPDLWLPAAMNPAKERGGLALVGRMKPGVSIEQARAEMAVLFRFTLDELTSRSRDAQLRRMTFELAAAGTGLSLLRDTFAKPLVALVSIAGLLLLIACANIAGLFLARGAARQYEIAVRVSLGAGRLRLMRHIFLEALLLSIAGILAGLGLAYTGAGALLRVINSGRLPPGFPPRLDLPVAPDAHVALFTGAVALLTALFFGLAPAFPATAASLPAFRLHDMSRAGRSRFGRFFGNALVTCQIALSMALVSAAALFVHYLAGLERSDLGFQPSRVLLVTLDPARGGYKAGQLGEPYRRLLRRIESVPGVRSATLSAVTPISGAGASRFVTIEGRPERAEDRRYVSLNSIAPGYFETLGTPLIAGRDFGFEDEGRPRVAIVNRAFSRRYFGEQNPIGLRISIDPDPQFYEIVALAGDAKYSDVHEDPPPTVYLNAFQLGRIPSNFSIRTAIAPEAIAPEIQRAIRDALPAIPVRRVTTLPDQIDASIVPERIVTGLAGVFGILGALLAGLGLYGLVAFSVGRRVNEIGVRMALGATQQAVAGMVIRDAFRIVCFGLLIGAPLAVASGRLPGVLISGLRPNSPLPLVFGVVVLVAIALLAAFAPARRAARIDPMEALRHE